MDEYASLRALPLQAILYWLGVRTEWKSRKDGQELYGPCPFCQPKRNRANFSFTTDGKFHCFSCSQKGKGSIDLVIAYRKVGFQEAVEILKGFDASQIQLPQEAANPRTKLVQVVENQPFKGSYEKFYQPSEWLAKRGFAPETLETFGVGLYDNPKRQSRYKGKILLPVRRFVDGEVVAYLARTPEPAEGEPKYIFPKGFAKHLELFGCWQLKEKGCLPLRVGFLVESPFCVMRFHQLGLPAVSPFGWSVSDEQVKILRDLAKGWVYLPDSDKHEQAAESVRKIACVCWVKLPPLPEGIRDPEQLTIEQIRSLS